MGDRANVKVLDCRDRGEGRGVYLYSHWGGSTLPQTLAMALDRGRSRWDDDAYLARIIFSQMVEGDENGLTGFGISTSVGDGADRVLIVDCFRGTVLDYDGLLWKFQDFVESRGIV